MQEANKYYLNIKGKIINEKSKKCIYFLIIDREKLKDILSYYLIILNKYFILLS